MRPPKQQQRMVDGDHPKRNGTDMGRHKNFSVVKELNDPNVIEIQANVLDAPQVVIEEQSQPVTVPALSERTLLEIEGGRAALAALAANP
jgi:hypothetical protein